MVSDKIKKIMYKIFGRWVTKQTDFFLTIGKIIKINKNTATVKNKKKEMERYKRSNGMTEKQNQRNQNIPQQ